MLTHDGKKICVECRQAKPATTEHFYVMRVPAQVRLQARCKLCDSGHGRRNARRRKKVA